MPRKAREKSESGIYHIMLRGINQQIIFEDEEDKIKLLEVIKEYKVVSGYKIFAFCLMGNHIHLLIKIGRESLEQIFKRIGGRYVYWYNGKYRRVGHLFQDRFKSETVEDNEYFLTVLKYIHQNPVKAKLAKTVEEYSMSSYNQYFNTKEDQLVDTEYVYEIISKEEFIKLHKEYNDVNCLEMEESKFRVTDEQAKRVILEIAECHNANEFQQLDVKTRDKKIKELKEKGLSIRQINRLTGISYGIARKSCNRPQCNRGE